METRERVLVAGPPDRSEAVDGTPGPTQLGLLAWAVATMAVGHLVGLSLPPGRVISSEWWPLGAVAILEGIFLNGWARAAFSRRRTPVRPVRGPTALVTRGPFAVSRNPMYLGMVVFLIGIAVLLGTVLPFLVVAAFARLVELRWIRREEELLEATFGDAYRSYRVRVGRWLGRR